MNCDGLGELSINIPSSTNAGGMSPLFCADMEADIGGDQFKGCYSINARDGSVVSRFNERICVDDPDTMAGSNDCDSNGDGTLDDVKSPGVQGGTCESFPGRFETCQTDTDCQTEFGGTASACGTNFVGACNPTDGSCS